MTANEMESQLWSLLVQTAHAQRVLTCVIVEQLTGIPKQAIAGFLKPIQDYCMFHNLPPLTSLVVNEIGVPPGEGSSEGKDRFGAQARVYLFDWLSQKPPSPDDFQKTTTKNGREMPWYGGWRSAFNFGQQARSDTAWDN
jgi:hypothetical protein